MKSQRSAESQINPTKIITQTSTTQTKSNFDCLAMPHQISVGTSPPLVCEVGEICWSGTALFELAPPPASRWSAQAHISALLRQGCYQAAIDFARENGDADLSRDTAVCAHRLSVRTWKAKVSAAEDCVLPSVDATMEAAESGRDLLCRRILEMLNRRTSTPPQFSKEQVRRLVLKVCEHWMVQTAYYLCEMGLVDYADVRLYEQMLEFSFLPFATHIAKQTDFADAFDALDERHRLRVSSKYTHCAVRFLARQSDEIDTLRRLIASDHVYVLADQDYVDLVRFHGILVHMTDQELAERRRRILGISHAPVDRFGSVRLLADTATAPWSEHFQRSFSGIFLARLGTSAERHILQNILTLPVSPASVVDSARMMASRAA